MFTRREAVLCSLLAGGGLGALAARPREARSEPATDLDSLLPDQVGVWQSNPAHEAILAPQDELATSVYDQIVARRFVAPDRPSVTLVVAHGLAQSYATQLHRPELCYPASGFAILTQRDVDLQIGERTLPASLVTARRGNRTDTVLYWTRVGETFPRTVWAQRVQIARMALTRKAEDGVLLRLSIDSQPLSGGAATLTDFAGGLHDATSAKAKGLLFGRLPEVALGP